jgi:hypothetical protein
VCPLWTLLLLLSHSLTLLCVRVCEVTWVSITDLC